MTSSLEPRTVSFSPPDIDEADIEAVVDALRSGWITTGPRTKELERQLCEFTDAAGCAAFSSATTALECCLRALGVGPGDEIITSAYTYSASASCGLHLGAEVVLSDTGRGSFEMDYDALADMVAKNTRVIIPVDFAGRMCDYDRLFTALQKAVVVTGWTPKTPLERKLGRPVVLADGAHSLGATYHGKPSGSVADFTAFSFHAVKNLTTCEGGALVWRKGCFEGEARFARPGDDRHILSGHIKKGVVRGNPISPFHVYNDESFYKQLMLLSLHGQNKDALAKTKVGSWEYDIIYPGFKCNMTDLQAALGLSQLTRYRDILARRRELVVRYEEGLADLPIRILRHHGGQDSPVGAFQSSCHLMIGRLIGKDEAFRNAFIEALGAHGVAANVHYKPLPMFSGYRNFGFDISDYPNAFAQYENEVTLPLHTCLSDEDMDYILEAVHLAYAETEASPATGAVAAADAAVGAEAAGAGAEADAETAEDGR